MRASRLRSGWRDGLRGGPVRQPTSAQGGFTLIELMVVVAIIAVLAMVVVPQFTREARKTKAGTEVAAFFTEIQLKEEQYKSDSANNTYLALAACPATLPGPAGVASSTCSGVAPWTTLNIAAPESVMRCQYTVRVGAAGDVATGLPAGVVFTPPTTVPWYVVWAVCDGDGSSAVNATYYASSVDSTIQKLNEGN
jgi:prepilin-type N-terminal cleavage/methylation domain-containing protein